MPWTGGGRRVGENQLWWEYLLFCLQMPAFQGPCQGQKIWFSHQTQRTMIWRGWITATDLWSPGWGWEPWTLGGEGGSSSRPGCGPWELAASVLELIPTNRPLGVPLGTASTSHPLLPALPGPARGSRVLHPWAWPSASKMLFWPWHQAAAPCLPGSSPTWPWLISNQPLLLIHASFNPTAVSVWCLFITCRLTAKALKGFWKFVLTHVLEGPTHGGNWGIVHQVYPAGEEGSAPPSYSVACQANPSLPNPCPSHHLPVLGWNRLLNCFSAFNQHPLPFFSMPRPEGYFQNEILSFAFSWLKILPPVSMALGKS